MSLESTSNSSPRTKYEFMVKEEAFPAACAYALSAFFVMSEGLRELLDGIGRLSLIHGSMTEKRYLLCMFHPSAVPLAMECSTARKGHITEC